MSSLPPWLHRTDWIWKDQKTKLSPPVLLRHSARNCDRKLNVAASTSQGLAVVTSLCSRRLDMQYPSYTLNWSRVQRAVSLLAGICGATAAMQNTAGHADDTGHASTSTNIKTRQRSSYNPTLCDMTIPVGESQNTPTFTSEDVTP